MIETPFNPADSRSEPQDDLELAKEAAAGGEAAREAVTRLAHPLIQQKTDKFCKSFCNGNNLRYRCTIDGRWGLNEKDVALCDWGNASYAWMLEDLTGPNGLNRYRGENDAKLSTYLHVVTNSDPFRERWKNFRFERRIYVPEYIEEISELAKKVFLYWIDRYPVEWMAQEEKTSCEKIEEVQGRILIELTKRKKMYLLVSPKTISLTGMGVDEDNPEADDVVADVSDFSWNPDKEYDECLLEKAIKKLTPVEQAICEAMRDGYEAAEILKGLVRLGISIKQGVLPEEINRQQFYYFYRKTIAKLKGLMGFQDKGEAEGK